MFSGIRLSCPANGFNDEVWYIDFLTFLLSFSLSFVFFDDNRDNLGQLFIVLSWLSFISDDTRAKIIKGVNRKYFQQVQFVSSVLHIFAEKLKVIWKST